LVLLLLLLLRLLLLFGSRFGRLGFGLRGFHPQFV